LRRRGRLHRAFITACAEGPTLTFSKKRAPGEANLKVKQKTPQDGTAMIQMSRFTIHDDETAPAGSLPVLKGVTSKAGQLPNVLGVLAGSPAALRAYARFRSELAHGVLDDATIARIALGVAELHGSQPGIAVRTRSARQAGIGLDEIARARRFESDDPRVNALLRWARAVAADRGGVPESLHESVREAAWTDEQLLEVIALVALESFAALVNVAGNVPVDGSSEETRQLRAVA
jgi:alkylhydroperoxidase family enzyme